MYEADHAVRIIQMGSRLQHEMALAELASAVATGTDPNRLYTLYDRVYAFKGMLPRGVVLIPPDLENRYEDAANRLRKTADFKRIIVLVATLSIGVAALVGFLIFVMTR